MDDTGATRDDLKVPDGDVGDECNAATAEGRVFLGGKCSLNISMMKKKICIFTSQESLPPFL